MKSLTIFYLFVDDFEGKPLGRPITSKRICAFTKSVTDLCKKNGRMIDFKIRAWCSLDDKYMFPL